MKYHYSDNINTPTMLPATCAQYQCGKTDRFFDLLFCILNINTKTCKIIPTPHIITQSRNYKENIVYVKSSWKLGCVCHNNEFSCLDLVIMKISGTHKESSNETIHNNRMLNLNLNQNQVPKLISQQYNELLINHF